MLIIIQDGHRNFMSTTTDLKKIVGQRLQLLRLERNLTQEQMSEKLHLSTSAYCKIEYGETDLTLTRLNKIAEIFGMPAVELFNKIDGNYTFTNNSAFVGKARDSSTVNIESNDEIKELIKANSQIIELLCKRLDILESKIS